MSVADQMRAKLTTAFAPITVEIVDESAKHAGHAGARPGGETHFRVYLVSESFVDQSRVARQRMVMSCLAAELADQVHALSIRAVTPDEHQSQAS